MGHAVGPQGSECRIELILNRAWLAADWGDPYQKELLYIKKNLSLNQEFFNSIKKSFPTSKQSKAEGEPKADHSR